MAPLRRMRFVLLTMLLLSSGCGCTIAEPALHRFEYAQIIMGVEARITLFAEGEDHARIAARAAFDRMADLDAVMSDYRPNSELMRACDRAGTGPIPISADLVNVLARARLVGLASDGAFDVTIGPVVALWREARRSGRLPGDEVRRAALELTGWQNVDLDIDARTLELARPGMRLDLGGIGKGFAADAALRTLRANDAPRALVDLGGDLVAGAPPPGERAWHVRVSTGEAPADGPILELVDAAVATSGASAQSVAIDGVEYAHIVDPRTGLGLIGPFTVTVIAADGATADALASAASVLGPVRGAAFVTGFGDGTARLVTQ